MKKYLAVGRRKSAVAQVQIFLEAKTGGFFINKKTIWDYFQNDQIQDIKLLMENLNLSCKDPEIRCHISGGGITGQKQALYLALARGIYQIDPKFLPKIPGILTQDSRIKERRKYGLKKARKAPQYSKR